MTKGLEVAEGAPRYIGDVVVNVRFLPNGLVNTITHRPDHLSPQAWFDHLCHSAPGNYRPLSGGRGTFVITVDDFTPIDAAARAA